MLSIHSCPLGKVGGEETGGMSIYIRELGREIGRRGHLVDVYTRIHEPIHDQVVEFGENARLIHFKAGEEETHKLELYSHLADFTRCFLSSGNVAAARIKLSLFVTSPNDSALSTRFLT